MEWFNTEKTFIATFLTLVVIILFFVSGDEAKADVNTVTTTNNITSNVSYVYNSTLWYNDSGTTRTTMDDVQVDGTITALLSTILSPHNFGYTTIGCESGVCLNVNGDAMINSGDLSVVGGGLTVSGSSSFSNNLGVSGDMDAGGEVTGSHVCDDDDNICLNETQQRVSGTCGTGKSIRVINSDGSVVCEDDSTGDNNYATSISITEDGAEQNISIARSGLSTIWATFTDNNSGGETLWYNDSGTTRTVDDNIQVDGKITITNDDFETLTTSVFVIDGKYTVSLPLAMLDFKPYVEGTYPFYGIYFRPNINTSQPITALNIMPEYYGEVNKNFMGLDFSPGTKVKMYNETTTIIDDNANREIINFPSNDDHGWIKNNGLNLGGEISYQDFTGGAKGITDNIITITGGVDTYTNAGSGVVTQSGLRFIGFENDAGLDTIIALNSTGGRFDFLEESVVNVSNLHAQNLTLNGAIVSDYVAMPFAYAKLDDDGTATASEISFGTGSAETSIDENVSWDGTNNYMEVGEDGVYEMTANLFIACPSPTYFTYRVRVNNVAVNTAVPYCHNAVDTIERSITWVDSMSTGDVINVTIDGNEDPDTLTIKTGSSVTIKRIY